MSNENQVVDQQQTEQQEIQSNPIEVRARELGWRPKEDFHGDENQFIDAAEFVRRQPLFEKIEHMGKELKETKKVLMMLQEHHTKVKQIEYDRAVKELRAEKKKALEEGDADRLMEIDDALIDIKAAEQVAKNAPPKQQQVDPRFTSWTDKNPWYTSDKELRSFADSIGTAYAESNENKTPEEVLKYVEAQVKRAYPEKFTNPKRTQPSAVEGSSPAGATTGSKVNIQLTDEERKVMNTFVRSGVMTKDEYMEQLAAVRG